MSPTGGAAAVPSSEGHEPQNATGVVVKGFPLEPVNASSREGVVVTDSNLSLIAADSGATSIFRQLRDHSAADNSWALPAEIAAAIRHCQIRAGNTAILTVPGDSAMYKCRVFFARTRSGETPDLLITVHFQRLSSANELIEHLARRYDLTDREAQTLHLMALGLAGKEIALRLKISPNTVKVFIRLVMVKMGVTTRAAVMARLLNEEYEKFGTMR